MSAPVSVRDDASAFPPVGPGRAREVDAAGGVCWAAQNKSGPAGVGSTCEPGPNHWIGVAMGKPTLTPPASAKVLVYKDGNRWHVSFPCDCPALNFRMHHVALIFATHHTCPPPWWTPIPERRKRLTRTVR